MNSTYEKPVVDTIVSDVRFQTTRLKVFYSFRIHIRKTKYIHSTHWTLYSNILMKIFFWCVFVWTFFTHLSVQRSRYNIHWVDVRSKPVGRACYYCFCFSLFCFIPFWNRGAFCIVWFALFILNTHTRSFFVSSSFAFFLSDFILLRSSFCFSFSLPIFCLWLENIFSLSLSFSIFLQIYWVLWFSIIFFTPDYWRPIQNENLLLVVFNITLARIKSNMRISRERMQSSNLLIE